MKTENLVVVGVVGLLVVMGGCGKPAWKIKLEDRVQLHDERMASLRDVNRDEKAACETAHAGDASAVALCQSEADERYRTQWESEFTAYLREVNEIFAEGNRAARW